MVSITAKMGRVVYAIIKRGDDYQPFVEGPVPGGGTPLSQCREGASATLQIMFGSSTWVIAFHLQDG